MSTERPVNYDEVSSVYDRRYETAYWPGGIAAALLGLAQKTKARSILEVGCGTGHWLGVLQSVAPMVCGMDRSLGMLQKAREQAGNFHLIRGDVTNIPFRGEVFDLVFCVNAIHHFDDPSGFIRGARQLLRRGGTLSIAGMDPHARRDRWFIYDWFPGTLENDLRRYPSSEMLKGWMTAAGLKDIAVGLGERIELTLKGREVLILDKNFTSQLSLLTAEVYADAIAKIEAAISEAEASGKPLEFITDISLVTVTGWVK